MDSRRRGVEDRWTPIAGQGSLGASYLPCCPARLLGGSAGHLARMEGLARLALLWSERSAALRFRRAVLAMSARTTADRLELARISREAFAYDAGAARLRSARVTRIAWLIRFLRARSADRIVGPALAIMSNELSVLHLSAVLAGAAGELVDHGDAPMDDGTEMDDILRLAR